jgi:hypothetical protein
MQDPRKGEAAVPAGILVVPATLKRLVEPVRALIEKLEGQVTRYGRDGSAVDYGRSCRFSGSIEQRFSRASCENTRGCARSPAAPSPSASVAPCGSGADGDGAEGERPAAPEPEARGLPGAHGNDRRAGLRRQGADGRRAGRGDRAGRTSVHGRGPVDRRPAHRRRRRTPRPRLRVAGHVLHDDRSHPGVDGCRDPRVSGGLIRR